MSVSDTFIIFNTCQKYILQKGKKKKKKTNPTTPPLFVTLYPSM